MDVTQLADTGQPITRASMGTWQLGGHGWGRVDEDQAVAAVRRALDLGVNFFDTADVYGLGRSEELLSRTLGKRRHDLVIASKFGVRWDSQGRTSKDISPRHLRQALEASLRRLRLDCIPLYYVHWPDGLTPIGETMAELARCRQEGKIRWIGLSNFSADQIREALAVTDVQALQVQFSLLSRAAVAELLPLAEKARITLVTWGSLAQGLLTGKFDAQSTFGHDDCRSRHEDFLGDRFRRNLEMVEALKRVAERFQTTPAQVALRWLLDTPGVGSVLFGAKSPAQVDDNLAATEWRLPDTEYRELGGWEIAPRLGANALDS